MIVFQPFDGTKFPESNMKIQLAKSMFAVLVVCIAFSCGCGGSDEATVIQPDDNFQPTQQDQANQQQYDAMRGDQKDQ